MRKTLGECRSNSRGKGRGAEREETQKEKIQRGKQLVLILDLGTYWYMYVLYNNELHTNETYSYKVDNICHCAILENAVYFYQ